MQHVILEKSWDESKHPRVPSGSGSGGQFVGTGSAGDAVLSAVETELGAVTAVTAEQSSDPTETKAFKAWFGDSKVVDATGKPLIVYHGTRADIAAFDASTIRTRFPNSVGFYFASSPRLASVYADSAENSAIGWNSKSPFAKPVAEGANVIPAYLSIKNPLIVTTKKGETLEGIADANNGKIVSDARAQGFDGVIIERKQGDGYDGMLAVAFEPEQIKSIFNEGTFNPKHPSILKAAAKGTLYVHRELLNPSDVRAWAKEQGFTSTLDPADMHVTVAFSTDPVDWSTLDSQEDDLTVPATTDAAERSIRALGPEGEAIVLSFASPDLEERWHELCDGGCSWDYSEYRPHVTLTYSGAPLDLRSIRPYMGELRFGPEIFEPINENAASGIKESVTKALSQLFAGLTGILKGDPGASDMHVDQPMGSDKPRRRRKPVVVDDEQDEPMMQAQMIAKSDDESRLVFGWGSVISKNGEPVVDTQEDVITPAELLKSTTEFMENVRYAAENHPRNENQNFTPDMAQGQVVHSFPLTADIAKALGIQTDREGWIIGVKVYDDAVWKRVKDSTLKGFSIGASAMRVPL